MKWAALLKGVNLNGRKLPMADLKAMVEGLGFAEVRTLLASGNVVFATAEKDRDTIEKRLEKALVDYGLKTDVVLRNGADLRAVMAANPFPEAARDRPSRLLVAFHRDPVPDGLIERLAGVHAGPERLQPIGRELFIDFTDGIAQSKLDQSMRKAKFPLLNTARNWNTVGKLADMLD